MAITVPTTWTPPSLQRISPTRVIRGVDHQAIIRASNHEYSRRGVRAPLVLRDLPWLTNSATLTQVASSGALVDLDREQAVLRLARLLDVAGTSSVVIMARIFGSEIEAAITIYAPDTGATLGTITVTQAGAATDWARASLTLTAAQASEGGIGGSPPRVLLASIEGRTTSSLGALYQVHLHAVIASSADMP